MSTLFVFLKKRAIVSVKLNCYLAVLAISHALQLRPQGFRCLIPVCVVRCSFLVILCLFQFNSDFEVGFRSRVRFTPGNHRFFYSNHTCTTVETWFVAVSYFIVLNHSFVDGHSQFCVGGFSQSSLAVLAFVYESKQKYKRGSRDCTSSSAHFECSAAKRVSD